MEKAKKGQAYNIATGHGITNRELVELIAAKTGNADSNIVFGSYPPGYPCRPLVSDQPYIVLDSTRARNELGWAQKVDLDQGLRNSVQYWKEVI
jgi:nucleoside-diphosphate-sugar epimerase